MVVLLVDVVLEYVRGFEFLDGQVSGSMEVVPLRAPFDGTVEYLTLGEAMGSGLLEVREVGESGSVPEVLVINRASLPVLVIDGEELEGAKQDRIVNATILLREKNETVIPVSCVEAGRWYRTSEFFEDSGRVAAKSVRFKKVVTVTGSLESSSEYLSDQRVVWDSVDSLHSIAGSRPDTGAMGEAFKKHEDKLEGFIKPFKVLEGQNGVLVAINGEIVGLEFVSRHSSYKVLHDKIIRSYALEALFEEGSNKLADSTIKAFMDEIIGADEIRRKSPGYGFDYRYRSKNCIGSALVYNGEVIHGLFFKLEKREMMPSWKDRMIYRLESEL